MLASIAIPRRLGRYTLDTTVREEARAWVAIGALLLVAAGCTSSSSNSSGAKGAAGKGADAGSKKTAAKGGSAGSAGSTGTGKQAISGTISEFAPGALDAAAPNALEGVRACVYEHSDVACATTDAMGHYELAGVPSGVETAVTFEKQGYLSVLVPGKFSADTRVNFNMPSDAIAMSFLQIVGATYPLGDTGVVLATAQTGVKAPAGADAGLATEILDGVSVSVSPKSGAGPFYANEGSIPDTKLMMTTKNRAFGAGFTNLTPGEVEVTFSHPSLDCSQIIFGWPSTKPHTARVPVIAGSLTNVVMRCE